MVIDLNQEERSVSSSIPHANVAVVMMMMMPRMLESPGAGIRRFKLQLKLTLASANRYPLHQKSPLLAPMIDLLKANLKHGSPSESRSTSICTSAISISQLHRDFHSGIHTEQAFRSLTFVCFTRYTDHHPSRPHPRYLPNALLTLLIPERDNTTVLSDRYFPQETHTLQFVHTSHMVII